MIELVFHPLGMEDARGNKVEVVPDVEGLSASLSREAGPIVGIVGARP